MILFRRITFDPLLDSNISHGLRNDTIQRSNIASDFTILTPVLARVEHVQPTDCHQIAKSSIIQMTLQLLTSWRSKRGREVYSPTSKPTDGGKDPFIVQGFCITNGNGKFGASHMIQGSQVFWIDHEHLLA